MLTPEQIREALKDRNCALVSRNIGIAYSTLHRFMSGSSLSWRVYEKLNNYIESSIPGNKEEKA